MIKSKFLVLLLALPAFAFQDSDTFLNALINNYDQKTRLNMSFTLGLPEAMVVQGKFVDHLALEMGPVVGYKAALTNPGARKKFGINEPIRGVLLEKMLLKSGATLPRKFGTNPLLEGDLMVRVGSDKINDAKTGIEILAALDAIIPFIELPDLVFAPGTTLQAAGLAAVNAGARLGVMGEPIAITEANEALFKALSKVRVEVVDEGGEVVAFGYANVLYNGPTNAVAWLRDSLLRQNKRLKKGDLLSLGSITQMIPVKKAGSFTARYFGIPGVEKAEVKIQFTD